MTTGATLLVMMDLALLLWSPRVWKEWMLRECWSSMLPSPGARLSRGDAETACCAALAVVPIIRGQLCQDGQAAGRKGGKKKKKNKNNPPPKKNSQKTNKNQQQTNRKKKEKKKKEGERVGKRKGEGNYFSASPDLGWENPRQAQGNPLLTAGQGRNSKPALSLPLPQKAFFLPAMQLTPLGR